MAGSVTRDEPSAEDRGGPLAGVRVLEFESIGPGPFAAMLLGRYGADVLQLRRPGLFNPVDGLDRAAHSASRPALTIDLKSTSQRGLVLDLAAKADVVIEGMRPGVMERLGYGPDDLLARNPALVYARATGYGQTGPLAQTPGHDINYLALSGVLGALGREGERPLFPLNLLGDYAGGGSLAALGVLAALLEAKRSGRGQVVDAAMIDGVGQLATSIFGMASTQAWGARGTNVLDSGAPFYDVYETADGRYVAVGAIEPQFYSRLLELLDVAPETVPQWDRALWPSTRATFAAAFRGRTRDEWSDIAESSDACVTPVLDLLEAPEHPHHVARQSFCLAGPWLLPRSAPRFDREARRGEAHEGSTAEALRLWGLDPARIEELREAGAVPGVGRTSDAEMRG